MKVDVTTEIVIQRPVAEVAEFAADPGNVKAWYANIKSVERETPRPVRAGSRVAFVAEFLGRRMAYTYEIASIEPGKSITMCTARGPFPMETQYTREPAGAGATADDLARHSQGSGSIEKPAGKTGIASNAQLRYRKR